MVFTHRTRNIGNLVQGKHPLKFASNMVGSLFSAENLHISEAGKDRNNFKVTIDDQ